MRVSEIRVNQIRVNQGLGVPIQHSRAFFLKKISCYQKSYRHVIYNTVWEFDVVPAVYTVAGGLFWFLSCRACPREKCSENAQLGIFSHLKPFLSFKSYMYT